MDAFLPVSALAMVLAVARADWVMSCCGVGSVAMSQTLDGQIMVRSAKQEEDTKTSVSWDLSVWFAWFLDSTFLRVSAMLWSIGNGVKVTITSWQTPMVMWHYKNGKIQSFSCSYSTNMDSKCNQNGQMTWKDTPCCVPLWLSISFPLVKWNTLSVCQTMSKIS